MKRFFEDVDFVGFVLILAAVGSLVAVSVVTF